MKRVAHQNAAVHWTFLVFCDRCLGFVVRADHHCYRLNNTANANVTAMDLRLTIIVVAAAAAVVVEPMAISVNLFVSKHF